MHTHLSFEVEGTQEVFQVSFSLKNGKCGTKEVHEPHTHVSKTLGTFKCNGGN